MKSNDAGRRSSQLVEWALALTAALGSGQPFVPAEEAVAATGQPNVVLVMTDDQGYGDLGCHDNKLVNTPALDRLFAESIRLTNFRVADRG